MKDIGCYIIFSTKIDRFYIGVCQQNLAERILKHNTSFYGKEKYTSISDDWNLYLFIATKSYSHALRIEKKIKKMKSKKYIENLKAYPELVEKIFNETLKST